MRSTFTGSDAASEKERRGWGEEGRRDQGGEGRGQLPAVLRVGRVGLGDRSPWCVRAQGEGVWFRAWC